jgi:thioredoxin reductase
MYDALVVGGGPAGLSAALLLGRCRRRVLVCDGGRYRNAASSALRGFLTRDGVPPAEFLRLAREQLAPYPVELLEAQVEAAARVDGGFRLTLAGGERLSGRALLLATGAVDRLPALAGLAELHGRSVFTCPYCDAWEVRGAPLAVYGEAGAALARALRGWSDDVVLLTDGAAPTTDELAALSSAKVRVVDGVVTRLLGRRGELTGIEFADGHVLPRRALFLKLGADPDTGLATQLGLASDRARGVHQRGKGETEVPGLYVAGDASCDLSLAIVAAADGTTAAAALHRFLQRQEGLAE